MKKKRGEAWGAAAAVATEEPTIEKLETRSAAIESMLKNMVRSLNQPVGLRRGRPVAEAKEAERVDGEILFNLLSGTALSKAPRTRGPGAVTWAPGWGSSYERRVTSSSLHLFVFLLRFD